MKHPVDAVRWVPAEDLHANFWNPNVVFTPELRLLEHSLLTQGWVHPLLVNQDLLIIDGFHRWRLAQDSKPIRRRDAGSVPIVELPLNEPDAMLLTVRINRAKGSHVARRMSELVRAVITEHGYSPEHVA